MSRASRPRRRIARALAIAAAGIFAVGSSTSVAAASPGGTHTRFVDDDHLDCPQAQFVSIQAAVLASGPNDKVIVCPGTYTEQVRITAAQTGLRVESLVPFQAIVRFPVVTTVPRAIFHVNAAQNVDIREFTITGPYTDSGCAAALDRHYGVRIDGGGSATLYHDHITHIQDANRALEGCQDGVAVLVGRQLEGQTGTAEIRESTIDTYDKAGIVVDNAGSYALIVHNVVDHGVASLITAPNGIQMGRGASGIVRENTVLHNIYAPPFPPAFSATGILVFDPGAVEVDHNDVRLNDVGIDAEDNGSRSSVHHNTTTQSTYDGISLFSASSYTVSFNETSDNAENGIGLYDSSQNELKANRAYRNADGLFVDTTSTGNTLRINLADENTVFDCADDSVGPGTGGTANLWIDDKGDTMNRPGICKPTGNS
jgi:parallel beta-helix repeat protein